MLKKGQFPSALVFTTFSVVAVMYYYKNGGPRDFGLYANAGRAFLHGENAYVTQLWRSGSLGSVFIYLVSALIPNALQVAIFQLISFLGFWSFAQVLLGKSRHWTWTLGLMIFISPVREVINTLQITGLVTGLLAVFLANNKFTNKIARPSFQVLQIVSLSLAVDLKPHSLIFVVILLFLKNWKRREIVYAALFSVIGHSLIDLNNKRILERDWIKGLSNLGNASGANGESTSIWKLIDYLTNSKVDTNLLSMVSVIMLSVFSIFMLRKCSHIDLVFIGLIISSLMTYMHYYDLAPLAILATGKFMRDKLDILGTSLIMFLILPREFTSASNLLILLVIMLIIASLRFRDQKIEQGIRRFILIFSGAALVFLTLHKFNFAMNLDYRMTHTLMTSESMVLIWTYLLFRLKLRDKLEFKGISMRGKA